jgi:hypothetical protein
VQWTDAAELVISVRGGDPTSEERGRDGPIHQENHEEKNDDNADDN